MRRLEFSIFSFEVYTASSTTSLAYYSNELKYRLCFHGSTMNGIHYHHYRVFISSRLMTTRRGDRLAKTRSTITVGALITQLEQYSTSASSIKVWHGNNNIMRERRMFSSSTSSPDDDKKSDKDDHNDNKKPIIIFPWRHSPALIPRLIPNSIENKQLNQLLTSTKMIPGNTTINTIATAYMFLDVPWYELIWISHFKAELASSMTFAFTQTVAQLLSNLTNGKVSTNKFVKNEDNNGGDDNISIDFHEVVDLSENTSTTNSTTNDEERTKENAAANTNSSEETSTIKNRNSLPLEQMMEEKLINLYQSAKEDYVKSTSTTSISKLDIRLRMIPLESELLSLYSIPYLSRQNAKDNPHLLQFYKTMLEKPSMDRAPDLNKLRKQYLDDPTPQDVMESTVIAQCLIWCEEIFYIGHVDTKVLYQGKQLPTDDDTAIDEKGIYVVVDQDDSVDDKDIVEGNTKTISSQLIPHLVRMERTITTKKDDATGVLQNIKTDWIITDIDDLLGGNLVV